MGSNSSILDSSQNKFIIKNIDNYGNLKCSNCNTITRYYQHDIRHKLNCKNKFKIPIFIYDKK